MKTDLSAQQLVYFRQNGHIRFESFPLDFQIILSALEKTPEKRDLWRHSPPLQKILLRTLGSLALELTGKKSLRLVCDQWIDTPPTTLRMKDLFCFQGLALVFAVAPTTLDIYEPSSLCALLAPPLYLAVFGLDVARFIENKNDPHMPTLKKMGYGYGDLLTTEFHPIIFNNQ